jgi:hypothetical protein
MNVSHRPTTTPSPTEALDTVHRDLAQIYNSIAEALRDDPEIMPWTLRELRGVLDYIQAVKGGAALSTSQD